MSSAPPIEAIRIHHHPAPSTSAVAVVDRELSVQQVVQHVAKVREIIAKLFKRNVHYGTIPGTDNRRCPSCGKYRTLTDGDDGVTCARGQGRDGCGTVFALDDARVWVKKSLYQPGVDTLCMAFRLAPEYRIVDQVRDAEPPHHVSYLVECVIRHAGTGNVLGSALGFASTRESKWGLIAAQRKCPACGQPAIKVSSYRDEAGNFYCYDKLGGCGAKYDKGDVRITKQPTGKVWREEMGEVANTVVKMAVKRAKVAAVLTVTAASDAFEQDLEDLQEMAAEGAEERTEPSPDAPPKTNAAKGPAAGAPTAKVDTGKGGGKAKPSAKASDASPSPLDRLLDSFGELGVTVRQIEAKLGRPIAAITGQDFDALRAVWSDLKSGKVRVQDAFPAPQREPGQDDDIPPGDPIPLEPERRDDGS